jgi:hypothetical protein
MSCNLSNAQLNSVLIPVSLRGLSQRNQCARLAANTKAAATLRCQLLNFFFVLRRAKRYCNQAKVYCPFTIPWNIGTRLTLGGRCLAQYHDFMIGNMTTGFSFLLWKTRTIVKNEKKERMEIQNGKCSCHFRQTCC